ncbi:hypothetical protein NXY15_03490 [Bacteroides thetaiotaomicron]|nr:hypothetical protein NXY15_03490 [Bacteroides thetaiotaomicron]
MAAGALLSANANNGANAGFGYLNANNRSSNANANIGLLLPWFQLITVAATPLPHRDYRHV